MAQAPTIQVEVTVPELTEKLIATLKAIMALPKEWTNEATITVAQLGEAMRENLLDEDEHDDEVCGLGIIRCPDCATCPSCIDSTGLEED